MRNFLKLHWTSCDFVVVDVEGNGETPQEIIELAVVPIRGGRIEERRHEWMVLPEKAVTVQATRIHGISNAALIGKPRFPEIEDEVRGALGASVAVGHGVSVDVRLLELRLRNWRPPLLLDTLRLARRVFPRRHSYSLASLATDLRLEGARAKFHRAAADARATAELFLHMARLLDTGGTLSLERLADMAGVGDGGLLADRQKTLF